MSAQDPVGTTPHIDALHFLGLDERSHLRAVVAALRRNHAVLFAGAGLSFNARCNDGSDRTMPSWQALVAAMADELEGVSPHDDALKVADLYEATHGRVRLGEKLRAQIPDADFAPGDVHKLIPLMGFREVITTNFDTLIERAFRARAIEPKVVVSGKDLVHPAWPRVVKANGCFDRAPDDVVITGEDFRKFESDRPLLVSFLSHVFVESLVLFVGFSLDDPAFRAIFGRVRDLLGRDGRVAYSIQGGLPPSQVAFWANRGLRIISLWSGEDDKELTFGARLFRLLDALLADARAEATAAAPAARLAPRLKAAALATPPGHAGQWHQAWRAAEGEPGLVLAAMLPETTRRRLAGHAAFEEELAGRRAPDTHRGLDAETLATVRATCLAGAGLAAQVESQRTAVALLGATVDQRRAPGRSTSGLYGLRWTRQLIELIADSIDGSLPGEDSLAEPGALAGGTAHPHRPRPPGPAWLSDLPGLLAQVRLLCWLESPTAESRARFAKAARAVDLRCLAAESDARQREAALHLMLHGSAADLDLVPGLLRRATDGRAVAQRIARREWAWVARPAVTEPGPRVSQTAPPPLTRAAEHRVRDLAPDVRFRLATFADAARDHASDYLEVLDWLRQMLHDQGPERLDGATLDLVYRHHHLYNDFDDLDADLHEEAHTPFHRRVRAENAAIVERAERSSRLVPITDRAERVRSHLRATLCALERGKSLARGPRTALDEAWREARELLAERADDRGPVESADPSDPSDATDAGDGVAWELLVMLAVQADGAAFERRRGSLFVELLRQRRLDLAFLVDGWRRRLGHTDFSRVCWTDARNNRVEDGGLHATLLGVAAGIKLAVQHVPWDPEARPEDARLLASLTDLTVRVLCAHHIQFNLRENLLSALAGLSRVAPVAAVRAATRRWIDTCARQLPPGRLGLGALDWTRLLSDDVGTVSPVLCAQVLDGMALQVLLGRARAERHRAQGQDLFEAFASLHGLLPEDADGDAAAEATAADAGGGLGPELRRQIRGGLLEIFGSFRSPDAFAWLALAARLRAAGLPLTGADLTADLSPLCFDETSARAHSRRYEWRRRLPTFLRGLAPFAAELDPAIRAWVLGHLDPEPSALGAADADATTPSPPPELTARLARWDRERLDAVAAWLTALRQAAPDPEIDGWLRALVQAGATGEGALGAALDALGDETLTLWANHAARLAPAVGARHLGAAVARAADEAIECLRRAGSPQPLLEVRLIEAVPSPPAVAWLAEKLNQDESFRERHAILLRVLGRRLVPQSGPDDAATRRLRAALSR